MSPNIDGEKAGTRVVFRVHWPHMDGISETFSTREEADALRDEAEALNLASYDDAVIQSRTITHTEWEDDIKPTQHCTSGACSLTFSHTAEWCGHTQPRRCGCPWCYPKEEDNATT